MEFQNKLIESRKDLQGAIGDYLQTEYKILIDTAKTDGEKQKYKVKVKIKYISYVYFIASSAQVHGESRSYCSWTVAQ